MTAFAELAPSDELLDRAQVARWLNTTPAHVGRLTRGGLLPAIQLGRKVRYSRAAVAAFLAAGGAVAQANPRPGSVPAPNGASRGRPRIHRGGGLA